MIALPPRPGRKSAAPSAPFRAAEASAEERARVLEERLSSLEREHNELRQAIFAAAQLQRKLCAPRQVRRGKFEIASEIFPVRYLSGDFYQVLDWGDTTGLAVADIAGKGFAAGLWVTHLIGLIRSCASSVADPAAALAAINSGLCKMQVELPMVAFFLARLDHRSGELLYCNAGLPPALLLRADGSVAALEVGGPILGVVPRSPFTCGRVELGRGDTLLSYSDGIVECRNAGDEEFGTKRLLAAAHSARHDSASVMLFSILGAAQDFAGSRPREDDLTLMVVRRVD